MASVRTPLFGEHHPEERVVLVEALWVEERQVFFGPALAFQVHRQQIGAAR